MRLTCSFCFCVIKYVRYQRQDQLNGWLNSCLHPFAEANSSFFAELECGRLTSNETKRRQLPSQALRKLQCLIGDHTMPFHRRLLQVPVFGIWLEHVQGAGSAIASRRVDQNGKLIAIEQSVGHV